MEIISVAEKQSIADIHKMQIQNVKEQTER